MKHSHQRITLSVRLGVVIAPLTAIKIDFSLTRTKG